MVKNLLSIFLGLFIPISIMAEPYKGFSSFAAMNPNFPCSRFLKISSHAKKPAMVILYGTFGTDWSCAQRFVERFSNKPHLLQIHFYNASCLAFKRCYTGEIFRSSTKNVNRSLSNYSPRVVELVARRARNIYTAVERIKTHNTTLLLSTGLEDRLSSQAYSVMYSILRKEWPYEIVRNPVGPVYKTYKPADYLELHGMRPSYKGAPCLWNGDGLKLTMSETAIIFSRLANRCGVLYAWTRGAQGIYLDRDFVRPLERNFHISSLEVKRYSSLLKQG